VDCAAAGAAAVVVGAGGRTAGIVRSTAVVAFCVMVAVAVAVTVAASAGFTAWFAVWDRPVPRPSAKAAPIPSATPVAIHGVFGRDFFATSGVGIHG